MTEPTMTVLLFFFLTLGQQWHFHGEFWLEKLPWKKHFFNSVNRFIYKKKKRENYLRGEWSMRN